ncbi:MULTISPECIES: hypothetical protein [unclassified Flavobacterium]|uniref:hypothetical protein n=1 Tax=unclassified Flavobacterium TaxID=196869 RepID=UPI00086AE13E|nr:MULTISPECIES: hypothetical protein [unclassified Flavobacterium]MBN9283033.1 hypothetical protein [Flavobacterium sp.]ODS80375.1 MAG: hypothetical protein ABS44_20550 [Chryseobacterium sp. SCN 40-13]OJV67667.1 MAG: hypothetical protein BGO42_16680 [Flavobacterium sp. 40-81]
MKRSILSLIILFFSAGIYAQNTNVQSEVKTTVRTIKDSEGEKKIVKTEELEKVQDVELKDANSKSLNKEMQLGPTQVVSKVKVTVDGVTRYVDVDRSAYYTYKGQKYQVLLDKVGYTIINPDTKKQLAVLRETSNNTYIVKNKNKISIGHFDANGDLIMETYDEKADTVTFEKAEIIRN